MIELISHLLKLVNSQTIAANAIKGIINPPGTQNVFT
jgi:hypothetical protein